MEQNSRMNSKLIVSLSLGAGLLGGFAASYLSSGIVHAQSAAQVPKMVQAKSFVLMNDQGKPAGILAIDKDGKPNLKLFDGDTLIWSARGVVTRPATE